MINGLITDTRSLLIASHQALQQHPKRIVAVVAGVLLGTGGAAFAVNSMLPTPSDIVVREVVEPVQPLALATDASLPAPLRLYRNDQTRSTDTANTLLKRLGVDDTAAANFIRSDATARSALLGKSGHSVSVETDERNGLVSLQSRWAIEEEGKFKRLVIEKTPTGFQSRVEIANLTASAKLASGVVNSSLFGATDDANVPDSVASQLVEVFSSQVDFHHDLHKGDRFSIVYETLEGDGEPLRTGRILSAEFVNGGKTYQAMWFPSGVSALAGSATASKTPSNQGAYYTLDGKSLHKSFLASPVEFSRVTSGFSMRFHPIHKLWKAHLGTDFATNIGTPVRSVADGVVAFAGVQSGYGNVVVVNHSQDRSTLYAHLSKINVRLGDKVAEGENIARTGASGWVTGPHLHFEFRVKGTPVDPVTTLASETNVNTLSAVAKTKFDQMAAANRVALAAASTLTVTKAQ